MPPELITVDGKSLAEFIAAKAVIASHIEDFRQHGSAASKLGGDYLFTIRQMLERCPDALVPASVAALRFIRPAAFRELLRADLASIERSLREADWKSATVMAGSALEALLLWKLKAAKPTSAVQAQAAALSAAGKIKKPKPSLDEWDLHQLSAVAHALKLITDDTAQQVNLARNFRNLIHPGKAIRMAQPCDRGTAFAAMAGVDLVVREFSQ